MKTETDFDIRDPELTHDDDYKYTLVFKASRKLTKEELEETLKMISGMLTN